MPDEKRRMWLIDAGYLLNAASTVHSGYKFDYSKLRGKLEEDGKLWRAYYLNSTHNPPTDAQDAFHSWVRSARGPQIITKLYGLKEIPVRDVYCKTCETNITLECSKGKDHPLVRRQQKGVDVGLATLALIHMDLYDTLILSSGDGDLLDAIEHITEKGKGFELVVFNEGVSTELQARADRIYIINDFSSDVEKT